MLRTVSVPVVQFVQHRSCVRLLGLFSKIKAYREVSRFDGGALMQQQEPDCRSLVGNGRDNMWSEEVNQLSQGKLSLEGGGDADYTAYRETQRLSSQSPDMDISDFISPPQDPSFKPSDQACSGLASSYGQLQVGESPMNGNRPDMGQSMSSSRDDYETVVESVTITRSSSKRPSAVVTSEDNLASSSSSAEGSSRKDKPRKGSFKSKRTKQQDTNELNVAYAILNENMPRKCGEKPRTSLVGSVIQTETSFTSVPQVQGSSGQSSGVGRGMPIRFSTPPSVPLPPRARNPGTRLPGIGIRPALHPPSPFSTQIQLSGSPSKLSSPLTRPPRSWQQGLALPDNYDDTDTQEGDRLKDYREIYRNCMEKRYRTKVVDTHCHLDFLFNKTGHGGEDYRKFKGENSKTWSASYEACITDFCDPAGYKDPSDGSFWCSILKNEDVYGAFGCHPHKADTFSEEAEAILVDRCLHKKVLAVGETGLDYSDRNNVDHAIQKETFRRQIAVALQLQKPLVIHCRGTVDGVWDDAEEDCLEIAKEMIPPNHRVHRHCFTLGYKSAVAWMEYFPNLYFGFTPLIINPSKSRSVVRDAVRQLDMKRIIVETDAPYFLPSQYRKREFGDLNWGHPALAVCAALEIAELKNVDVEEVLFQLRQNTRDIYRI